MSAKAVCNVCLSETEIETTPLGIALMPQKWFCTVRDVEGTLKVVDVCSKACAEAFDKSVGRTETIVNELEGGEPVRQIIPHKDEN